MNAARNLRGYLPQELREVRSVEGTEGLASLALEISGVSDETERDKVTNPKKMPSLKAWHYVFTCIWTDFLMCKYRWTRQR